VDYINVLGYLEIRHSRRSVTFGGLWSKLWYSLSPVNDRNYHDGKLLFGSLTSFVPIN